MFSTRSIIGLVAAAVPALLPSAPAEAPSIPAGSCPAASDPAALLDPVELDVRDLTSFEWEVGDPIPEDLLRYDGRRVIIRGFMYQGVEDVVDQFPLVAESCQCNERLLPHHFIDVTLKRGDTGPIPGEFEVLGKLSVGEVEDEDGFVVSLFRLKGEIY
ncbi:hypothetical protein Pla163_31830 [Planctomycetes bacterium Pla163]|jgi:hypothetical protein|uniref:DUF3299 domain-containing protein n=1 Tax=Rohdeia mirabilis TaxID=2528008 RepID=A0A518D3K6_9BACT|nr:hypothetical protein Pla163_31830 [Planctomycetes bacterium Pla163]